MNRQASTRAIFLAAMVFASSAFAAGNDIQKCVTDSGHVTLTDEVCPSGSRTVKIISAPAEAGPERVVASATATVATERYAVARIPTRYPTMMRSAAPARGLALDIATLRSARANMQMFDNASQSLRQQRVAALQ